VVVDEADRAAVEALLGRPIQGDFEIVVRHGDGSPVVLRNAPLLRDGTPMPTRYWLVGEPERTWVSRLEADGGVNRAEAEVDLDALAAAHVRYAAERDAAIPITHTGHRPSGGVGGTRAGVKCLHAHYAWHLAGGDDPVGRWIEEHLDATRTMSVLAAIDCGTNSTRLLISDGRRTIDRRMVITRLGSGVDASGHLDSDAIQRTVDVLRDYRALMDERGVTRVRITATSAARDAANAADFFDAAEAVIGTRPELLSGEEEGQLSFAGATADLDPSEGPFLVVDIGGGSTECMVGTDRVEAVRSFDVGCVRLTEKHLESDPPAPEELSNAIAEAADWFDDLRREVPAVAQARTVVGLAGTISTVAAVEIGLAEWDREAIHHFRLTRAAIEDVFRTLATESLADRVHNPGLEAARADVIVGGCCALVAFVRALGIDELLVSESDILDGLVASLEP